MKLGHNRRIGGSDLPKLLGLSPYGGPFEVFERIHLGIETPWKPVMERGVVMEPVLRSHGQRVLGLELEDTTSDYHDHPGNDFARAQIDDLARWNGMPVAVDYKSQNAFMKGWGPDGSDIVPEHLRAQLTWEMACSDREMGLLVVGFGTDLPAPDFFHIHNVCHYEIERDYQFEAYCLLVAKEFWTAHVLTGTAPPITAPVKKKRKAS